MIFVVVLFEGLSGLALDLEKKNHIKSSVL